jgi:NADH-quinone oxidoreductase subunit H
MHPWLWIGVFAHLAILGTVAYLILLERKIASWVQDRIGPNRVGLGFGIIPFLKDKKMFGLGQPLADGLKFVLKEDYQPKNVDRILFTVAPMLMIAVMIVSIAVLPWGGVKMTTHTFNVSGSADPAAAAISKLPLNATVVNAPKIETNEDGETLATVTYTWPFQIADLDIGVLFILAVLSLAVYGVVVGGWASNNKYSFLGGLRATANMISYEVPLGLSVLTILLMFGTLNLRSIVDMQAHYWLGFIPAWNIFCQPLAFLMFLVCIHAEANRAPFDTAEAEQELVGGYHTEYSSMRFALFFLAEYAGMITTSAVCVALFFGGWHFPGLNGNDPAHPEITNSLILCIVRALVFFIKTVIIIGVFMWVRWSLPRFRFDQIMNLAWRALIPISLLILLGTAMTMWIMGPTARAHMRVSTKMAGALLVVNAVMLIGTMIVSTLIPAAPDTNRRVVVPGSRFNRLPTPTGA